MHALESVLLYRNQVGVAAVIDDETDIRMITQGRNLRRGSQRLSRKSEVYILTVAAVGIFYHFHQVFRLIQAECAGKLSVLPVPPVVIYNTVIP